MSRVRRGKCPHLQELIILRLCRAQRKSPCLGPAQKPVMVSWRQSISYFLSYQWHLNDLSRIFTISRVMSKSFSYLPTRHFQCISHLDAESCLRLVRCPGMAILLPNSEESLRLCQDCPRWGSCPLFQGSYVQWYPSTSPTSRANDAPYYARHRFSTKGYAIKSPLLFRLDLSSLKSTNSTPMIPIDPSLAKGHARLLQHITQSQILLRSL